MSKVSLSDDLEGFRLYLIMEEKSRVTVEKYLRDASAFFRWLGEGVLDKAAVLGYKAYLLEKYATASVNAALSSINSFFGYIGRLDLRVKTVRSQRKIFLCDDKELTKREYESLLKAAKAKGNRRLYLLMQTICSTGIRVSELQYITVSTVNTGRAIISCKGKERCILLPERLCKRLRRYAEEQGIARGAVFVSSRGNPLDRSNIWSEMKKLCKETGISEKKVFPHNLRHLFARTYYTVERDIVRLADILGHSSVNTTRIYTMETGEVHQRQLEGLGLLRC